jgi:hypothetical protein
MKRSVLMCWSLLGLMYLARGQAQAPEASTPTPAPAPPPQPIYTAPTRLEPNPSLYLYEQKPAAGSRPYLIAPEQAQSIITRFKEHYAKLGAPRVVVCVNRDLVERTGMTVSTNNPGIRDPKDTPLADRQTVRDVERLFGRPLRMAGLQLADQHVASQLVGSRDREALSRVAEVLLEILVSSKEASLAELSGDRTYTVPDIQATAIRLSDARILGQATAADLIGQGGGAAQAVRTFGMREIVEATALSLMEDMMSQ